jgi:hypothetical protein
MALFVQFAEHCVNNIQHPAVASSARKIAVTPQPLAEYLVADCSRFVMEFGMISAHAEGSPNVGCPIGSSDF